MRRVKKILATVMILCLIGTTYGSDVLAAGTEYAAPQLAGQENSTTEDSVDGENNSGKEDSADGEDHSGKEDSADGEDHSGKEDSADGEDGSGSGDSESGEDGSGSGDSESGEDGSDSGDTGDGEDNADQKDPADGGEGSDEEDLNDGSDTAGTEEGEETDGAEDSDAETEADPETEEVELMLSDAATPIGASGDVSRVEWLEILEDTFEMSVAKDNYPDNYYSDIDASSEVYPIVMVATEFGLVDVEAGDAFRPDDPATREFAAHTLNYCLGFMPGGEGYSFSESADVTYPDDIQVAIDRKWFQLSGGKFLPETPITTSEKTGMVTDAKKVLEEQNKKQEFSNEYHFADGVIALSETTEAELTDENKITLRHLEQTLQPGDRFGIVKDGFPIVYRVAGITQSGDETVVTTENVAMEEAFADIDMESSLNGELAAAQAYNDSVEISYIVGGTQEQEWEDGTKYDSLEEVGGQTISALEAIVNYAIPDEVKKDFDLGDGIKATVSCKVSNVNADCNASLKQRTAYIDMDADVIFGCNVSMDVLEASGVSPTIDLVRIPVACVGFFAIQLNLSMKGEVTLSMVENIAVGVHYSQASGFRMTRMFTKESFTVQAYAQMDAAISYSLGVNVCNCLTGSIYGEFGARAEMNYRTYDDGQKPLSCSHIRSWFYASTGCRVAVDLVLYKDSWQKKDVIYSEANSPVRVSFHYEDGVAVPACTREDVKGSIWKYYTSADSRYGYNGASKGVGANGESYSIFDYTTDDVGNATITKYQGNVSALSIPKTLDGHKVVAIDDCVFQNNKTLRVVVIPDSVMEIGSSAFSGCVNLSQVTLSKKLETLGASAFGNCDALTEIEIPKSLKTAYSYGPFRDCDGLKEVVFEEGVTRVVGDLFYNCPGLEQIKIPDTVTVIEYGAFYNCSHLKEVSIPSSVTEIGDYVFQNCISLGKVVIPDSVMEIGSSAFSGCVNLSQVTLSKKLETLGGSAFYNCDALTEIEIPKSLKTAYSYGPFRDCDGLKEVVFEEGVTKVVGGLFYNCSGLEQIEIPDTVTVVEDYAFYNCSNLKEVSIPSSVTEIGDDAFQNCVSLSEVVIPDSVTSMGTYIFSGCSKLQEAVLPAGRINITAGTFNNCANLAKVNFPETLEAIRSRAFYNTALSEAVLPAKVNTIEDYAFYNCDSLSRVEMGNSVVTIGDHAFYDCDALEKIVVPDSVTELGSYLFAECEKLCDVSLGTGITEIPAYAFNLCPSLQKIILPYRTAKIGANAFTNCTALTEITIPRATTSIADTVFSYPSKMTIYGVAGTYAETYANTKGITFVDQEVGATEVRLNTETLDMIPRQKISLVMTVVPSNFTDEVTWKSSAPDVAAVDDTGLVTGKSVGSATVKVTVGNVSASCTVRVAQPVTSIRLNKTSLSLEALDTCQLTAAVSPASARQEVTWSSEDRKIATVDETGLVTAVSKGTVKISATATDGSDVKGSCTVTVTGSGHICSSINDLQSDHPYADNSSDFWLYTKEGAESLYLTFDEQTDLEENFDFLYLYYDNAKGKETLFGTYTGKALAGQTVEIPGSKVKIKLVSDEKTNAYGFKVVYLMGTGENVENDQYMVTFDSRGGTAVAAQRVEKGAAATEPEPPVRAGYTFAGWYLDSARYEFGSPVTGNIVLYAVWNRIPPEPEPEEEVPEEDKPESGVVPSGLWVAGVTEQTYTGKAIKQDVRVYDGSHRLTEKTDYTVSYKNNTKANDASDPKKAPTITVKGKGNYTGSATALFRIDRVNMEDESLIRIPDITLAYTGKVQKKAPTVLFNGKKLGANGNYTITYPDTAADAYQKPGTYRVQIAGTGNFTGTKTVNLTIAEEGVALLEKVKCAVVKNKTYTGEAITLTDAELILYTKSKNSPLVKDTDYEIVSYENNTQIGTASVTLRGKGGYAGDKTVTFKITGTPLGRAKVNGIVNKVYNGQAQTQELSVTLSGTALTPERDYTVAYDKNVNVGTASVIIQGVGAYTGTVKKTFKITAYDMGSDPDHKLAGRIAQTGGDMNTPFTVKYVKGGSKPEMILMYGDMQLENGKDYTLTYKNNTKAAAADSKKAPMVTVKGKGNFKGTYAQVKFSIEKRNLADVGAPIDVIAPDVAYVNKANKYGTKPVLTDIDGKVLKAGTDYTLSYTRGDGITKLNNKSKVDQGAYVCVYMTGKGNYYGSLMASYRITEGDFTKAKISVTPKAYTGRAVSLTKDDIKVTVGGQPLVYGTDYEILEETYTNNIKKGTASVQLKGIGKYGGVKKVTFKIQARKMEFGTK